jgi:hypothetical protein
VALLNLTGLLRGYVWLLLTVVAIAFLLLSFILNSSGTRNVTTAIAPSGIYGDGQTFVRHVPIVNRPSGFDLMLTFNAKGDGYQDLFDTATGNDGVRVEIYQGSIAVVVGNGPNPGTTSYGLANNLAPGQDHQLSLHMSPSGDLKWAVDNVPGYAFAPDAQPLYSVIMVGNGFNGTRPFQGTIRNVTFSYTVESPENLMWLQALRAIAAIVAVVTAAVGLRNLELSHDGRAQAE